MGSVKPGLLVVLGLLSLGCEDRPPLPPVVFEGEHIRYRTFESEDEVCAGSFFMQDAKTGYLKDLFGTETTVDFSWIPDDRYFDYCPGPPGCAIESEVFAQRPVMDHELSHGARESSYPPFEEGLAVYFGDGGARDVTPDGTLEALLRPDVEASDYGRLGRFVSYLVAEFGLDEVIALGGDVPRGISPAQFEAAVGRRLGAPLVELVADFGERYPECQPMNYRDDRPYCDQPSNFVLTTGMGADAVEHDFDIACDDEGTYGNRSGKRWRYETFTVPERTVYSLTIKPNSSTTRSFVVLEQCGTSCFEDGFSSAQESYDGIPVCLDEGTYAVRMMLDDGTSSGFQFSATPIGWC